MNISELESLRDGLNRILPPSSLSLLYEATIIEWDSESNEAIDLYCDILIRISADVIFIVSSVESRNRQIYFEYFNNIARNIQLSGVLDRSTEFKEYFRKYIEYLSNLNCGDGKL